MIPKRTIVPLAALAVIAISLVGGLAAKGGSSSAGASEETDRAFAQQMVPHHRAAVTMARIARDRAQRAALRRLAGDIITAQSGEIAILQRIDARLGAAGVKAGALEEGASSHSVPMNGDTSKAMAMDPSALRTARPFDRAFIDMMIPHHQSAIVMARAELARGNDAQVRTLARAVIDAQSREIAQMNDWRQAWYGDASPAGGIPAA